ncbi:MAG: PorP/SprF family type IX secretion system membrane protein [Flavobacteriales bacterium]|nr:PorP/SprF family type IX secretion system membrane protein [Bacteroidota bacterium]MCB9240581.1 PorP/SprF family type IX secretion system membrane protein [Flavobacteriales bacterium]
MKFIQMKRSFVYILGLLLLAGSVQAQQIPLYSQYYFNKFLYNPAYTGMNENTEAHAFGRRQYTNIDGYQTSGLTLNGTVQDGKMGIGAYFINDVNTLLQSTSFYGNYAYHLKLSDAMKLSFGFALGAVNTQFDLSNIVATDPNDPVLRVLDRPSGASLDASIGANITLKDFRFGLSFPQFMSGSQKLTDHYNNTVEYDLQNHLTLIASYDINVNENLMIQPMVLYKNTANSPGQADINLTAEWKKRGYLGIGIRDGYGVSFMGGMMIAESVRFGYAYDVSTGQYSTALGGSHEFLLGYVFGKKESSSVKDAEFDALKEESAAKSQMQDKKIAKLEETIEELERRPNRVDTVVVVQKVPTQPSRPAVDEEPAKPKPSTPTATKGEFLVIAGSFGDEANATIYFNQLVNKGKSPYMYYHKPSGTFYVHLGKFTDKEQAREYVRKNSSGSLKLWVKTI